MRAISGGLRVAGLAAAVLVLAATSPVAAQDRTAGATARAAATDMSSQARRQRAPTRLRVERYQRLPATAVRTCNSWYAQEHRPSGTVIVPKMSCRWISG